MKNLAKILMASFAVFLFIAVPALAQMPVEWLIYVDNTNPNHGNGSRTNPYRCIQWGIDDPHCANGNALVIVKANPGNPYVGSNNVNLTFGGKDITLRSSNLQTPGSCFIDCQNTAQGFIFSNSETRNAILEGFTIKNAYYGQSDQGGGITCISNSNPTIRNCVIQNCNAVNGAGVFIKDSDPGFSSCDIKSNTTSGPGGGCYLEDSGASFDDCTIQYNWAYGSGGGGVDINIDNGPSDPEFKSCIISFNSAPSGNGGGVRCMGNLSNQPDPTFEDCTIESNEALSGGGVFLGYSKGTFTGVIVEGQYSFKIKNNTANDAATTATGGGGVYLYKCTWSNFNFTCIEVTGNTSTYSSGGGVLCFESIPFLDRCYIHGNTAPVMGGGIHCVNWDGDPSAMLLDTTIHNNQADLGAGLSCYDCNPTLNLCDITDNDARNMGINKLGGGIYCNMSNMTFSEGEILRNYAKNGAGIYCTLQSQPTFDNDSYIKYNIATESGGALYCKKSSPIIQLCWIIENGAGTDGGGLYFEETYDLSPYPHAKIDNCLLRENGAQSYGGGICTKHSGTTVCRINLNLCTIKDNAAQGGGNGIYSALQSALMNITNCIIWGNAPQQDITVAGTLNVTYTDHHVLHSGNGNISTDPLYTDSEGRLTVNSPCKDSGDNNNVYTTVDLDGNPRKFNNGIVDMGAFEIQQ